MYFWVLLLCGLLLHTIFLASVFDVYFNSPVIHGIKEFKPSYTPEAKRLVLIVADGLRARSFFANHSVASPYLRQIIEKRGTWGVSHTRVPTESRPGHVAMIAGLYEDPSAVTKGWKENPVEFDSVFNRSSHTWAWGSQDILPMFAKGEASGRVSTHTYPRHMQRFSGDKSNEKLDTWVLDRVLAFFDKTREHNEIRQPGCIFFLHLLGIDTTGHATKPHSKQYIDNIKLVDTGIRRVEETIERYYKKDGKTVYVFTADHGMTDWGSHGTGLSDETETPLVVWGAGVSGPQPVDPSEDNHSPEDWGLNKLQRRDVEQADIAALMSALLALPTPTNSVGLLPRSYLVDANWVPKAVFSNAHQLVLQFERAQELIQEKLLSVFFRPFPRHSELNLDEAEIFEAAGQRENAVQLAEEVAKLSLEGIQYYLDYFSNSLKFAVTSSHFLWLAYLAKSLLKPQQSNSLNNKLVCYILLGICAVATICILILVLVQSLPLQYVVYYSLPCILIWAVFQDVQKWWPSLIAVIRKHKITILVAFISTVIAIAILVCSFFHRGWLSAGLVILALWPTVENRIHGNIGFKLCLAWAACCVCLAVFPMLPVIGRNSNYLLVLGSGIAVSIIGLVSIWLLYWRSRAHWIDISLLCIQCLLASAAAVNVYVTSLNFTEGLGLTLPNQIISWFILGISILLPICTTIKIGVRLSCVWFSLVCVLTLLSVSHELLFLLFLLIAMTIFPLIEHKICNNQQLMPHVLIQKYNKSTQPKNKHRINTGDLRRSYFYLFFTVLAFFGLGNVASLNSFDPSWVRCFVTTFDPFLMGGLILLKTIAPFLAVACGVRTAIFFSQRPVQWLLVLALCDALALPFFHLVVTTGSWLDIGQSISHFVIAHLCVLLLLLLHYTAHLWLSKSIRCKSKVPTLNSLEPISLSTKDHGE